VLPLPFTLIKFACQNGISIKYCDLEWPIEALYYFRKRPWIILSNALYQNKSHFRSVLAEEIGHHFTGTGDRIIKADTHYKDVVEVGRQEHRAMVWAGRHLIPGEELEKALSRGMRYTWELAEHFCCDEELVKLRLVIYFEREKQGA
jgi:Domain of unknown function (DUF955).